MLLLKDRYKSFPVLLIGIILGVFMTKGIMIAYAQATASVVRACARNSTGALRVLNATDSCDNNETYLEWNQQGLEGATGSSGAQGLVGPTGSTGAGLSNPEVGGFINSDLSNKNFGTGFPILWSYRNFSGFNFANASLSQILFDYCDVSYANFNGANLVDSRFFYATVTGATFVNANLSSGVSLLGTDFSNVNFTGANLNGISSVYLTRFTNANFTNATLRGVYQPLDTTGAIWSNTTCPDETNSDNNGGTCDGHFL